MNAETEFNEPPMTDQEFENALELLMEIMKPPKLGPHTHKCGFDTKDKRGCGFEWTHDGRDTQQAGQDAFERTGSNEEASKVYDDLHACPQCGRGPWKLQVTPRTRQMIEEQKVKINLATGETTELA